MSGYASEELIGTPFADYFADTCPRIAGVQETLSPGRRNGLRFDPDARRAERICRYRSTLQYLKTR